MIDRKDIQNAFLSASVIIFVIVIIGLLTSGCTAIKVQTHAGDSLFWMSTKRVTIKADRQKGIYEIDTNPDSQYLLIQKLVEMAK